MRKRLLGNRRRNLIVHAVGLAGSHALTMDFLKIGPRDHLPISQIFRPLTRGRIAEWKSASRWYPTAESRPRADAMQRACIDVADTLDPRSVWPEKEPQACVSVRPMRGPPLPARNCLT